MTYLEVHSQQGVHRWPIGESPTGGSEECFLERIKWINNWLAFFDENMAYAFKDPQVYIIHESKMSHVRKTKI